MNIVDVIYYIDYLNRIELNSGFTRYIIVEFCIMLCLPYNIFCVKSPMDIRLIIFREIDFTILILVSES